MSPRVLVICEDKAFTRRLIQEGQRQGAKVDWYWSFAELGRVGRLGDYDCVVADLSSDPVTGIEVAQFATAFFSDLPVILLSDEADPPLNNVRRMSRLPAAVQARIPKQAGAATVMRSAVDMAALANVKAAPPSLRRAGATRQPLTA